MNVIWEALQEQLPRQELVTPPPRSAPALEPPDQIFRNINIWPSRKIHTIPENCVKIVQRMRQCDTSISRNLVRNLLKFSVLGPHSPTPALTEWYLVWRSVRLPHAKYHPHRCSVSPLWECGVKNLKPRLDRTSHSKQLYIHCLAE